MKALFELHASSGKECGVVYVVVVGLAAASSMFHARYVALFPWWLGYVASLEGDVVLVVGHWSNVALPTSNTSDVDTLRLGYMMCLGSDWLSRDVGARGGEPELNNLNESRTMEVVSSEASVAWLHNPRDLINFFSLSPPAIHRRTDWTFSTWMSQ